MKPRSRSSWAVGLFLLGALLLAGAAAAAGRTLSVEDVLRLHSAGVSEDIIISEIVVTGTVFDLQVDDLLRLQQSGISDRLLQFMVDTGREEASSADSAAVDSTQAGSGDDQEEAYATEDHPRYFVSLNWGYPAWWYDAYWWDYWYYDCAYSPWYVSWSWPYRGWYPGWYYGHCWVPSSFGYQQYWWHHHGFSHDPSWAWDRQGWAGWHSRGLSDHKYKIRGGSSGKILYADAGLRTRDLTRLPSTGKLVVRSRPDDLALDARKLGGDLRRPVHATSGQIPADVGRGVRVRHPATPSGTGIGVDRGDVRRPVHPVRRPAPGERPLRKIIRRGATAPTTNPPDVRRTGDGLRERPAPSASPDAPPARVEGRESRPEPPPRASSPPPDHGGRGDGGGGSRGEKPSPDRGSGGKGR
ncbi:MAG: hypothetical protein U0167_03870 [bacterium]